MKILIAEDDVLTGKRLRNDLEEAGFTVTTIARSLGEAIKSYGIDPPDFSIIDIALGDFKTNRDGIDLANWLGELNKVPFIFLTGHVIPPDEVIGTKASNYLVKPYLKEQLITQIRLHYDRFREKGGKEEAPDSFYIRENGHLIRIPFEELLYVKGERHRVSLHTVRSGKTPYLIGTNLGDILHYFSHPDLITLPPSLVLNKKHIRQIREDKALIGPGENAVKLSANARRNLISKLYIVKTRSK